MENDTCIHPLMRMFPQFFDLTKPGGGLINRRFATGPGWDGILAIMLWRLAQQPLPTDFRLEQVKEKLGRLRVYHNKRVGDRGEAVGRIIASADEVSSRTCEFCGATDAALDGNRVWVKTLCPPCAHTRITEQPHAYK